MRQATGGRRTLVQSPKVVQRPHITLVDGIGFEYCKILVLFTVYMHRAAPTILFFLLLVHSFYVYFFKLLKHGGEGWGIKQEDDRKNREEKEAKQRIV